MATSLGEPIVYLLKIDLVSHPSEYVRQEGVFIIVGNGIGDPEFESNTRSFAFHFGLLPLENS